MYREYDKLVQAARRARNEASDDDDDEEEEDDDDELEEEEMEKRRQEVYNCALRERFHLQSFPALEVLKTMFGACVRKRRRLWIHNCSGKTPK